MKIAEMRQRRVELAASLNGLIDKKDEFDRAAAELTELDAQIARSAKAIELSRGTARPHGDDAGGTGSVDVNIAQLLRFTNTRAMRANWGMQDYIEHARAALDFKPEQGKHFRGFGEFLLSVMRYYSDGRSDDRLQRSPIGAGETDASAGGFLVQTDFASTSMPLTMTWAICWSGSSSCPSAPTPMASSSRRSMNQAV